MGWARFRGPTLGRRLRHERLSAEPVSQRRRVDLHTSSDTTTTSQPSSPLFSSAPSAAVLFPSYIPDLRRGTMILRYRSHPRSLSCALLLLSLAAVGVSAADLFNCHAAAGDYKYDLAKLAGVHTITREWDSPPTKWKESLSFNLCEALPKSSSPEADQVSTIQSCTGVVRRV